jgi:hypothetical protein
MDAYSRFRCLICGKNLKAKANQVGQTARCTCGATLVVPSLPPGDHSAAPPPLGFAAEVGQSAQPDHRLTPARRDDHSGNLAAIGARRAWLWPSLAGAAALVVLIGAGIAFLGGGNKQQANPEQPRTAQRAVAASPTNAPARAGHGPEIPEKNHDHSDSPAGASSQPVATEPALSREQPHEMMQTSEEKKEAASSEPTAPTDTNAAQGKFERITGAVGPQLTINVYTIPVATEFGPCERRYEVEGFGLDQQTSKFKRDITATGSMPLKLQPDPRGEETAFLGARSGSAGPQVSEHRD